MFNKWKILEKHFEKCKFQFFFPRVAHNTFHNKDIKYDRATLNHYSEFSEFIVYSNVPNPKLFFFFNYFNTSQCWWYSQTWGFATRKHSQKKIFRITNNKVSCKYSYLWIIFQTLVYTVGVYFVAVKTKVLWWFMPHLLLLQFGGKNSYQVANFKIIWIIKSNKIEKRMWGFLCTEYRPRSINIWF